MRREKPRDLILTTKQQNHAVKAIVGIQGYYRLCRYRLIAPIGCIIERYDITIYPMLYSQRQQMTPRRAEEMATTTGTRSGNPAKKAAAKKAAAKKTATRKAPPTGPSSVGDFKKRREGTPLLLPSGLVMTCRRVELQTYLKSSQGDVYNPLLGIVGEALEKGQMIDTNKLVADEDGDGVDLSKLNEMYDIVNGMVIAMAVNPPVHPEPESEDDRDDNLLYVDEVEDEDKMFLFQWGMGGTDDIATFRREAEASMDALAKEPSNKPAAKRAPGSRKR